MPLAEGAGTAGQWAGRLFAFVGQVARKVAVKTMNFLSALPRITLHIGHRRRFLCRFVIAFASGGRCLMHTGE